MSDLFEEDIVDAPDIFDDLEVDTECVDTGNRGLDARRRLEQRLEEKRLRDELEDFY